MIVYAQSGREFHREEKDEGEILHLGQFQFHFIFFFSFWAYFEDNMWNLIFLIWMYSPFFFKLISQSLGIITWSKGKSWTVRAENLSINLGKMKILILSQIFWEANLWPWPCNHARMSFKKKIVWLLKRYEKLTLIFLSILVPFIGLSFGE